LEIDLKIVFFLVLIFNLANTFAEEITYRDVRNAIFSHDIDLLDKYLSNRELIKKVFKDEDPSIIEYAVRSKNESTFKKVLASSKVHHQSDIQKSLQAACSTNNQSQLMIRMLIENGGDINTTIRGQNCLYYAVLSADYNFYKFLISVGASKDVLVRPDKELGLPAEVNITDFIKIRLQQYNKMNNT
jgi:hypothetical protein